MKLWTVGDNVEASVNNIKMEKGMGSADLKWIRVA
jgi:hypothetical protein